MKMLRMLLLFLALIPAARGTLAANPVVNNVQAVQRTDGSRLVDIGYDLFDADGDTCSIAILASENGGDDWWFPCLSLTGDVGANVTPNAGRLVVWDLGADAPGFAGNDFKVQVIASDNRVDHRVHSPMNYTVHQSGTRDWTDPILVESIARADILVVTAFLIWDNGPVEAMNVVDMIKSYNPDCKVIGYNLVESIRLGWADDTPGSYGRTLYDALLPYWSYTTTGDTLSNWPDNVGLNILDPDCRDIIVTAFVEYQAQSATKFDGIFWDYFPYIFWIPDFVSCEGEPDLDGDGIDIHHDPDEREAYHLAQEDLVTRMRIATGDAFPQILNGRRANSDSALASLGDGMNYELFPTMEFPGLERMRSALDPAEPISLWHAVTWPRTAAGGPYLLIENNNNYRYYDHQGVLTELDSGDFFRVLGFLIDGVYPIWDPNDAYTEVWPANPLNLGDPVGPTQIVGDVFTREFTYGDVWMELKGGDWPDPFRYRITLNGNVIEELDVPYHFP